MSNCANLPVGTYIGKINGEDTYSTSIGNYVHRSGFRYYLGSGYGCPLSDYPSEVGSPLRFVSPLGVGTTCTDMIALVYGGKKYWLTSSEFAGFGNPVWEEVSLNEFQAIPDGTSSITVSGVTISPKDTSAYCGVSESGISGINPSYLILGAIAFIILLLFRGRR